MSYNIIKCTWQAERPFRTHLRPSEVTATVPHLVLLLLVKVPKVTQQSPVGHATISLSMDKSGSASPSKTKYNPFKKAHREHSVEQPNPNPFVLKAHDPARKQGSPSAAPAFTPSTSEPSAAPHGRKTVDAGLNQTLEKSVDIAGEPGVEERAARRPPHDSTEESKDPSPSSKPKESSLNKSGEDSASDFHTAELQERLKKLEAECEELRTKQQTADKASSQLRTQAGEAEKRREEAETAVARAQKELGEAKANEGKVERDRANMKAELDKYRKEAAKMEESVGQLNKKLEEKERERRAVEDSIKLVCAMNMNSDRKSKTSPSGNTSCPLPSRRRRIPPGPSSFGLDLYPLPHNHALKIEGPPRPHGGPAENAHGATQRRGSQFGQTAGPHRKARGRFRRGSCYTQCGEEAEGGPRARSQRRPG